MPERSCTVQNRTGLHARPARAFAETAALFPCTIRVRRGGKCVNGKSVIGMLTLGAKHGDVIVVQADGEGSEQALAALAKIAGQVFVE